MLKALSSVSVVSRRLGEALDACNSSSGCGIKLGLEPCVQEGKIERFIVESVLIFGLEDCIMRP